MGRGGWKQLLLLPRPRPEFDGVWVGKVDDSKRVYIFWNEMCRGRISKHSN